MTAVRIPQPLRRVKTAPTQLYGAHPAQIMRPKRRQPEPAERGDLQLQYRTLDTYRHTDDPSTLRTHLEHFNKMASDPTYSQRIRAGAALQADVTQSFLAGPMRNKKMPLKSRTREAAVFERVKLRTLNAFLHACALGRSVHTQGDDRQRALINLPNSAKVIGAGGEVGVQSCDDFFNAAETSHTRHMLTLLAQGPKGDAQVHRHIQRAMQRAHKCACKQVMFVNLSEDKVPSFEQAVRNTQPETALALHYRSLWWPDGEVPQTRDDRRSIVDFAESIGNFVQSHGKTLVVFNCHMGLDRSGVVDGLVQMQVDLPHVHDRLRAGERALYKLNHARHHAISTLPRFILMLQCDADRLARSNPPGLPDGSSETNPPPAWPHTAQPNPSADPSAPHSAPLRPTLSSVPI